MKTYEQEGYNRLAKLLSIIAFIVTFIILSATIRRLQPEHIFIAFPIASILVAALVFFITRIIYWVIDGFKKENV